MSCGNDAGNVVRFLLDDHTHRGERRKSSVDKQCIHDLHCRHLLTKPGVIVEPISIL